MAHGSRLVWLAVLVVAGSASAATVGAARGRPVTGRPLEVNIPFAVDEARDRACASANVRYGNTPVPRMVLHVQGSGLKRNLLVTSHAKVNDQPVTVNVRVGCGAKAATRSFVLPANLPAARKPALVEAAPRQVAFSLPPKPSRRPVAVVTPPEPLFPPPEPQALPQESGANKADASTFEELRKARADAAAATAQLEATRKELAAVLDVERRTSQTLIDAEHQVRDAESEVAGMRLVLKWTAAALALAAAGIGWLEFARVTSGRRRSKERPSQEPTMLSSMEAAA